jgi:ribosome recycling factor
MIDAIKSEMKRKMENSLHNFQNELKSIRTGRATPSFLEHVMVEIYDNMMPINQLGTITAQDTKMLIVQVWDKAAVKNVEKAINNSDLGVNASADGQLIRVPMPPLSEERRKDLVKLAGKYSEQTKVSLRNIRRDSLEAIKKLEKEGKISEDEMRRASDDVQKVTDEYSKKIETALSEREKEIMHV